MGFGKEKNSINEWRKQERQLLRELCPKYGLEIAAETQGWGKTFTPDEYKKMRDEAKEELQTYPEIMYEIKGEIYNEVKTEATAELQADISKEKSRLETANAQLAQESVQFEGKIALEQRVKSMIDGMREETRGWGNNKKPHTIIELQIKKCRKPRHYTTNRKILIICTKRQQ